MTARRRIIANLDCEADFAGHTRTLKKPVLERLARVGSLFAVFAGGPGPDEEDGETELWLPAACETPVVEGLPDARVITGPLADLEPAAEELAWGAFREHDSVGGEFDAEAPLIKQVWRWPRSGRWSARQANDRSFALRVATYIGCALPGAAFIRSAAELDAWVGSQPGDAVVKACWCAAGRDRAIGPAADPGFRQAALALLYRHGMLVGEPWMHRTLDVSLSAVVTADEHHVLGIQQNLVHPGGAFRGIRVCADRTWLAGLTDAEFYVLHTTAAAVAEALRALDYHGPFGIDAWCYSNNGGGFHPLGEINARFTFGFIARAFAERAGGNPARTWQLDLPPRDSQITFQRA